MKEKIVHYFVIDQKNDTVTACGIKRDVKPTITFMSHKTTCKRCLHTKRMKDDTKRHRAPRPEKPRNAADYCTAENCYNNQHFKEVLELLDPVERSQFDRGEKRLAKLIASKIKKGGDVKRWL